MIPQCDRTSEEADSLMITRDGRAQDPGASTPAIGYTSSEMFPDVN